MRGTRLAALGAFAALAAAAFAACVGPEPIVGTLPPNSDGGDSSGSLDGSLDGRLDGNAGNGDVFDFSCGADAAATGMVAYLSFDEGEGGVAHDCSGNGLYGILQSESDGGPPIWTAGHRGTALTFNAPLLQEVSLGGPNQLTITGAHTVSAWVLIAGGLNPPGTVCGRGEYGPLLTVTTASSAMFGEWALASVSSPPIVSGTWTHVAGVFRPGQEIAVYVQGGSVQTVPTDAGTVTNDGNLPFLIGASFTGAIDEVRMFNRALSASEISQLAAQ